MDTACALRRPSLSGDPARDHGARRRAAFDGSWVGTSSNEWTDGTNWSSNPDVPNGTATFSTTGPTSVTASGLINIGSAIFTALPNVPAYTITTGDIFVVNAGITNNSANTQTFTVGAGIVFLNSSTASGGTNFVTYGVSGGVMSFNDTSTAGTAHITNGGDIEFNNSSTAGTATIVNNAVVNFNDTSSANGSNITNSATGFVTFLLSTGTAAIDNSSSLIFSNSATAGSSTVTTENGGTTSFTGTSTGGSARFITMSAALDQRRHARQIDRRRRQLRARRQHARHRRTST